MKILKIIEKSEHTTWDVHVDFEMWANTNYCNDEEDDIRITNMCEWIGNTFKENYILLEHSTITISGGNVDNKTHWNGRLNENHIMSSNGKYQLRFSHKDLTIFMLKYNEGNRC